MKYFIRTFFIGLFLIVSINIFIDKDSRFFRDPFLHKRNLIAGECMQLADWEDDRVPKNYLRKLIPQMDVLFMGSSRVSYFGREVVKDNVSFYNANFAVGSIEDYIAVWYDLKSTHRPPKTIVIFLDHWALNKKANGFRAWENIPSMKKFLESVGVNLSTFKKPWGHYTELLYKRYLVLLKDLFSFDYFKDSLIKLNKTKLKGMAHLDCNSNLPKTKAFLVEDGHALYPHTPTQEQVLASAQHVNGALQFSFPWKLNQDIIEYFRIMIKDAKSSGVNVVLVMPLWHPVSYNKIIQTEHGRNVVNDLEGTINSLGKELSIDTCTEKDATIVGCSGDEFEDGMHMDSRCSYKLLKFCSNHIEPLKVILK